MDTISGYVSEIDISNPPIILAATKNAVTKCDDVLLDRMLVATANPHDSFVSLLDHHSSAIYNEHKEVSLYAA
jgi:hypothetical protein